MGLGAKPHYLRVFFLLAFSFALAVSKEKAVFGVRFCLGFRSLFEKRSAVPTAKLDHRNIEFYNLYPDGINI